MEEENLNGIRKKNFSVRLSGVPGLDSEIRGFILGILTKVWIYPMNSFLLCKIRKVTLPVLFTIALSEMVVR